MQAKFGIVVTDDVFSVKYDGSGVALDIYDVNWVKSSKKHSDSAIHDQRIRNPLHLSK